jgi:hypothetical protein
MEPRDERELARWAAGMELEVAQWCGGVHVTLRDGTGWAAHVEAVLTPPTHVPRAVTEAWVHAACYATASNVLHQLADALVHRHQHRPSLTYVAEAAVGHAARYADAVWAAMDASLRAVLASLHVAVLPVGAEGPADA